MTINTDRLLEVLSERLANIETAISVARADIRASEVANKAALKKLDAADTALHACTTAISMAKKV